MPFVPYTGDPVIDGKAQLAIAPPEDRVLWRYRVGAAALRRGQNAEAKTQLDDALALAAGQTSGDNADAAKSRRLFRREASKPFVGEPYERIMAGYYRGILYWQEGEPDNARALFRTGEFLDSDLQNKTYAGDWVLLDYLDGLASFRFGDNGAEALARARASAVAQHRPPLPDYDLESNVLFFVEYGRGPWKYAGGEYGELLKFRPGETRAITARLEVGGRELALPPYDDVHYQATTRGGRVMDHILGNKAVFKTAASNIGDAAIIGGVAVSQFGRGEDRNKAALAMAAVGLVSKLAGAAANAEADTRTWDNLPQYLSFAALRLPPGEHAATLTFYDAQGRALADRTQVFTIVVPSAGGPFEAVRRDTVVFRSEVRS